MVLQELFEILQGFNVIESWQAFPDVLKLGRLGHFPMLPTPDSNHNSNN